MSITNELELDFSNHPIYDTVISTYDRLYSKNDNSFFICLMLKVYN